MRTLAAMLLLAAACGGPKAKHESSMVNEGSDAPTCCCKTIPATAEKEIVPNYAMSGRMECSTAQGECVDDVQCNGQHANGGEGGTPAGTGGNGNPPPPPDLPKGD
jgi:hypothetical protein